MIYTTTIVLDNEDNTIFELFSNVLPHATLIEHPENKHVGFLRLEAGDDFLFLAPINDLLYFASERSGNGP